VAVIFAAVPLAQIARGHGRLLDVAQPSGVALGLALAALWHFGAFIPDRPEPIMALALLALAGLPAFAFFLARRRPEGSTANWLAAAQAIAALLGWLALAQVLPEDALAWTAAAIAAVLAWRAQTLWGAIATLAAIAALWALAPLFEWLRAGTLALVGTPMRIADLPSLRAIGLHLLPAIAGGAAWSVAAPPASRMRRAAGALTVALAAIAGHSLFRHGFAALVGGDFVLTGVAERAAWEALLLAAAWWAWTVRRRPVAIGLAVASLAHFAWFTVLLHNPLWSQQAVGTWSIANLLPVAYAAGLAALLTLRRWLPGEPSWLRWAVDGGLMLAIVLLVLSELRQMFAGSLLTAAPIGPSEDLLRSFTGILLAIGFLLWGARTRERSWRIGSLALMLVAVLKAFLVDAAGLEGLARVASFMALGFSLIGIGWFYARQLRE
jgi:uncharacterized membrane protein